MSPNINYILEKSSEVLGTPVEELRAKNKTRHIVEHRSMVAWLLREVGGMSYPAIAKMLGRQSHVDAMRMVEKVTATPTLLAEASHLADIFRRKA